MSTKSKPTKIYGNGSVFNKGEMNLSDVVPEVKKVVKSIKKKGGKDFKTN